MSLSSSKALSFRFSDQPRWEVCPRFSLTQSLHFHAILVCDCSLDLKYFRRTLVSPSQVYEHSLPANINALTSVILVPIPVKGFSNSGPSGTRESKSSLRRKCFVEQISIKCSCSGYATTSDLRIIIVFHIPVHTPTFHLSQLPDREEQPALGGILPPPQMKH